MTNPHKINKKQYIYIRRRIIFSLLAVMLISLPIILANIFGNKNNDKKANLSKYAIAQTAAAANTIESTTETTVTTEPAVIEPLIAYPTKTSNVIQFDAEVESEYGILVDIENNTVLAERNGSARIYPASMTKVMTLVVAVENIDNFNDTFTMTNEILEPLVNQGATRAGFEEGESCNITDMLYGAILPSGADATVGLAQYTCGSENAFVELMNEKAKALGLKDTHFVNTSGLYDENHYTTCADMAVIMEYAIQNDLCRKVLSTYQYTTSATPQHPQGIALESTMFSRMYGTEVENVTILGGKMGYTDEAGNCLVSFAVKNGKEYVAVSAKGAGRYVPIFDSFDIYGDYLN